MADEYIKRTLAKAEFTGNFRDEYPTALIHALIDSVPAADVASIRHGRWENSKASFGEMCSECKFVVWWDADGPQKFNFCPNCGAKMDGEREKT